MTETAFLSHMRNLLGRTDRHPPPTPIATAIYESWLRCLRRGLDPFAPPPDDVDTAAMLARARERHGRLCRLARIEMEGLHRLVVGSGHAFALASPDGMILETLSDRRFNALPQAGLLRAGSVWSEARCGTNGVGTTALLGRRLSVSGHEHFFVRLATLSCSAAPIFAPDGALAGLLDASCDRRDAHPHTQALVTMAATAIENALLRACHRDDIVVAVHPQAEALGTQSTGLLAIAPDGTLRGASKQARALLAPAKLAPGESFATQFATRLEDFLEESRRHGHQLLETHDGVRIAATIESVRTRDRAYYAGTIERDDPSSHDASFVADDPEVARIAQQVDAAARRNIPILIRGATGTGKEQMARHAHRASGRSGAFVPVNCASLPASLVEAELFGYAEGAFTGARRGGAIGLAKEADGGTLFLDEIGDMPVALQAVLLRFLDDYTVRPIAGTGFKVDVLLVSATNAGLDLAIAEGRFRMDLLYRLNTVEVMMPALAGRADFARIVDHLLAAVDPRCAITQSARRRLAVQAWPGNIRQLRNVVARLSLGARDGLVDEAVVEAALGPPVLSEAPDASLKDSQRARILAAYAAAEGNVSETSRRLQVSRNTVYRALGKR